MLYQYHLRLEICSSSNQKKEVSIGSAHYQLGLDDPFAWHKQLRE